MSESGSEIPKQEIFEPEEQTKTIEMYYWGRHRWVRILYRPMLSLFNKEFKTHKKLTSKNMVERKKAAAAQLEEIKRLPDFPKTKLTEVIGRDDEIQTIMNSIYYHIIRDKRIRKANPLPPPQIFMIKGQSGTGKTFLIKGIMNEAINMAATNGIFIKPFIIVASEIFTKWYGESSAKLGRIFNDAISSPSILFIDEAQTFTASQGGIEGGGSGDENSKVQGTILQKIDMIQNSNLPCIVLFGTNEFASILDTVRRRSHPIDLDLGITSEMIDSIINVQKKQYECELDTSDIHKTLEQRLRSLGHGQIVPSDIVRTFEMANQEASGPWLKQYIKKILARLEVSKEERPKITLDNIEKIAPKVRSYTEKALTDIARDAKQTMRPLERLSDVGGLSDVKDDVVKEIRRALRPDDTKKLGVDPKILNVKFLFFGPPGTGKTLLAKAIAGEYNVPFFYKAGPNVFSGLVGSSEKNVRDIFIQARKEAPAIVFFDEIDAIGAKRGTRIGDAGVSENVITVLLAELDGFVPTQGVIFIASTNRKDMLDDALLERLNRQYEFPLPKNISDKRDIVRVHYDRFRREMDPAITLEDVVTMFLKKTFSPRIVSQTMELASGMRVNEIQACEEIIKTEEGLEPEKARDIRKTYAKEFKRIQKIYSKNNIDEPNIFEFWNRIYSKPENHKITMLHLEDAFSEKSKDEQLDEMRQIQDIYISDEAEIGKVYGLACDARGQSGIVCPVECQIFPSVEKGKGKIEVFGSVRPSIVESAKIARTYFRRYVKNIMDYDIVFHFISPAEGVDEDIGKASGPSAGMAITMAMLSTLTSMPTKAKVAMTGKIEMRGGKAGAVGGIQPKRGAGKLDACREIGFNKVIIPKVCYDDLIKDFKDYADSSKEQGCEIVGGADVWDYASNIFEEPKEKLIEKLHTISNSELGCFTYKTPEVLKKNGTKH